MTARDAAGQRQLAAGNRCIVERFESALDVQRRFIARCSCSILLHSDCEESNDQYHQSGSGRCNNWETESLTMCSSHTLGVTAG